MKPGDKDKLNQCLSILETTDLGLSMVWLWTWDTAKGILNDGEWKANIDEDQLWDNLCEAVSNGMGFSLEYGSDQHYEEVMDWMLNRDMIDYPEEELV